MELKSLKTLLERKNQRFVCTLAGDRTDGGTEFTAAIRHEVTAPLNNDELEQVSGQIGRQDQLLDVLSQYGSIRLYCDTLSDQSAYYIAHPKEWGELYRGFGMWLENLDAEEREELLPAWIGDAIVIGEIPQSGNYYLYATKGDNKGKVFQFEHDGFEFIQVGNDLYSFIDKIATVSEKLISEISGYTRYSDGKTDIQWLAQRYEFDR